MLIALFFLFLGWFSFVLAIAIALRFHELIIPPVSRWWDFFKKEDDMQIRINTGLPPANHFAHPSTCHGCKHFNGSFHGGNLLVCAMHPYGVTEKTCPDKEKM